MTRMPLYDLATIVASLDQLGALSRRFDIDILAQCTSTSDLLMARAEAGAPSGTVVVAEQQTAGRGRRGRPWQTAPESSMTFSLLHRLPPGVMPAGLSLAIGVALAETLEELGISGVLLKWPNDVQLGQKKLAGILVELVSSRPQNGMAVVIGIGLNLDLPADLPADIRTRATSLADSGVTLPARNVLFACLLAGLQRHLERFASHGFAGVRAAWQSRNAHAGQEVQLLSDHAAPLPGRMLGVDDDGALLLATTQGTQRILSGEVSLRSR